MTQLELGGVTKGFLVRPKYARDKTIKCGMKVYSEDGGTMVARLRPPKGGGNQIGVVVSAPDDDGVGTINLNLASPSQEPDYKALYKNLSARISRLHALASSLSSESSRTGHLKRILKSIAYGREPTVGELWATDPGKVFEIKK